MATNWEYKVDVFPVTDADIALCRQAALTLHVCATGTTCPLLGRLETRLNTAGTSKWELIAVIPPQYPMQCCKLIYKR